MTDKGTRFYQVGRGGPGAIHNGWYSDKVDLTKTWAGHFAHAAIEEWCIRANAGDFLSIENGAQVIFCVGKAETVNIVNEPRVVRELLEW